MHTFSKQIMRYTFMLAMLLAFTVDSLASHFAGADLFYTSLGGQRYRVTLRIYRDCSGATVGGTQSVELRQGLCGSVVQTIPLTEARRAIQDIFCDSYDRRFACTATVDPANPNRPTNFEGVDFVGTVTIPGNRRDWHFTWTGILRPALGNVGARAQEQLFISARLNNLDFATNNSSSFDNLDIPLPYVCVNQPYTYRFSAIESDGDSLSYELRAPLQDCSTSMEYDTYVPGLLIDTTNPANPSFAVYPGGRYDVTFPISSWVIQRDAATGRNRAVRYFQFDPKTGATTFIPRYYVPPANTADPTNKYAMVVRIIEHRRDANGVYRIVGETQRDVLMTVVDCSGRSQPQVPTGTVPPNTNGGVTVKKDSNLIVIKAQTCTYTLARLSFRDSSSTAKVKVYYPGFNGISGTLPFPSTLAQFNVTGDNTTNPRGTLRITPALADSGKVFRFAVRLDNDACPVKGQRTVNVELQIVNENLANVVKPGGAITTKDTICIGDSATIAGSVSRPDTGQGGVPILYSYTWTQAPGLRNADLGNQTVTVTPPATMRYRFRADNPVFAGCYDTASVLVVVRTPVTPIIRSFFSSTRPGVTTEPPVTVRLQNGSYPLTDANSCRWYLRRYNRNGNDLVLAHDSGLISSKVHPDTLLVLDTPGVYIVQLDVDTRTKSSTRCYATAYDTIVVPEPVTIFPNVVSPNGDGLNEILEFKVPGGALALTLYNRYGVPVKTFERYNNDYSPSDLPAGTYYYLVKDINTGKTNRNWFEVVR